MSKLKEMTPEKRNQIMSEIRTRAEKLRPFPYLPTEEEIKHGRVDWLRLIQEFAWCLHPTDDPEGDEWDVGWETIEYGISLTDGSHGERVVGYGRSPEESLLRAIRRTRAEAMGRENPG